MRKSLSFLRVCSLAALAVLAAACDSPQERAQSYYERGLKFVAEGDTVKANLEFRNALKLNNDFVPALYQLAKVEAGNRRLDRAARIYLRIVDQDPEHVDARVELASILLLAGQIDQALKIADQAYALAPENPRVLNVKASIAIRLSDGDSAVEFAGRALKLDPGNSDSLLVLAAERFADNDPKGALALIERGTERDDGNLGLQLFRMRALEELGDQDGVETVFLKLVSLFPEDPTVNQGLARWYLGQKRPQDAETAMRQYVLNNPENTEAGLRLVQFLQATKDSSAAENELLSLIDAGKDAFAYQIALADLYLAQGKRSDAVSHLEQLVENADTVAERSTARVWLVRTLSTGDDGTANREAARTLVEAVLKEDGRNVDALTMKASLLASEDRLDAAIENLRVALDEDPESAQVRQMLSEAYERNGATALAEEQLARALQVARADPGVRLAFARFLIRYGKTEQAERVLSEMVQPDREILKLLAQLRLRNGDWSGAQAVAEQLRIVDDESINADQILAAALRGQSRYEESLDVLQSSISSDRIGSGQLLSLVRTHVAAGAPEQADAFLDTVLASDPDNVEAHILKSSLKLLRGDADGAESGYRNVIEIDSGGIAGHRALSALYLRDRRFDDAERIAREGLVRQPEDSGLRLFLAMVLEQAGNYEKAIKEYEIMLDADPRSTIAANNLASLISDHRSDQESLDRAFALASRLRGAEVPQFLDTLGWIHHRRGEHGEAVTLLKTAAEQLPDLSIVHYHLGMAYIGLERPDLARESLENAIALAGEAKLPYVDSARKALSDIGSVPAQGETN